jgi:creatinine amidohydrolase/Fe(II)-dependent formamide hydrolase-like protein
VVLPPLYIGRPGYSRRIGTLTFSAPCVELVLTELLGQLAKVGARVVVILSGHYGDCQVDCVKRTAREFEVEHPDVRVLALPEYEDVLVDGEVPADHAKRWETSLMKAIAPDSVRLEAYRTGEQPIDVYPQVPNDYYKEDARWSPRIDLGALDLEALGKKALDAIADHLAARIRALLP